jgi:hypothetical protein
MLGEIKRIKKYKDVKFPANEVEKLINIIKEYQVK